MKAVVMAGGEGTRLRPLTSNQPKPMVPIVGKPCMEHILDLLRRHDMHEVVVTLAFMPQAIRTYFGDGTTLEMDVDYSVEEQPLGTAGSVRLARERLDDTFLVISGDALCDVDLTGLVAAHREKGAAVTIALKSVDNPLEFGIVVTDEDGRVERFLEKPSWDQPSIQPQRIPLRATCNFSATASLWGVRDAADRRPRSGSRRLSARSWPGSSSGA